MYKTVWRLSYWYFWSLFKCSWCWEIGNKCKLRRTNEQMGRKCLNVHIFKVWIDIFQYRRRWTENIWIWRTSFKRACWEVSKRTWSCWYDVSHILHSQGRGKWNCIAKDSSHERGLEYYRNKLVRKHYWKSIFIIKNISYPRKWIIWLTFFNVQYVSKSKFVTVNILTIK